MFQYLSSPPNSISAAILITGGFGAEQSAELFLPWSNSTCELPQLPDERYDHVQSGDMMCGGEHPGTRNCVKWSAEQGDWLTLPLTLTEGRDDSTAWTESRDHNLIILGGQNHAGETSETVSSDGVSTRTSFKMKYRTE